MQGGRGTIPFIFRKSLWLSTARVTPGVEFRHGFDGDFLHDGRRNGGPWIAALQRRAFSPLDSVQAGTAIVEDIPDIGDGNLWSILEGGKIALQDIAGVGIARTLDRQAKRTCLRAKLA